MVAPLPLTPLVLAPFALSPFMFAPLARTPVIVAAPGHRDWRRRIRNGRRSDVHRLSRGVGDAQGYVYVGERSGRRCQRRRTQYHAENRLLHFAAPAHLMCVAGEYGSECRRGAQTQVQRRCEIRNGALSGRCARVYRHGRNRLPLSPNPWLVSEVWPRVTSNSLIASSMSTFPLMQASTPVRSR